MRDKLFAVVLAGTAAGAIMLTPAAGYTAGAAENAAAHDIAEKFAREAAKGDAQARQRAENDRRQADAVRRKAADEQRKIEEAEMLARARAEAEQRRMEIERARAEAERADRERRAEEERRLAEAEARRKAEEAKAAEAARLAEAARKAEEERRLAEIRAEEEARAAAAVRKAEEEHRQAEEARRTAEAEQARIAEEARQAEAARKAAEDRRLAEIRAEEEARAAEAIRKAAEEHRLAEEARLQAEASRRAEDDRRTAERARLEAEREAEAERLAERLRSVREARDAQALAGGGVEQLEPGLAGSAGHRTTSGEGSWDPPPERARHVAVLLLMQPGDRGIRRNNRTADPVLCGYHACYVSNGPDRAASLLPVRKALGFFRTWGRRAGACNNSLGCVFRDVDVDALGGVMRPVDMRVVRHDRREAQDIQFASQCEIHRGRLMCADGIYAEDYAMWLVPERTAAAAGPAALMQALDEGLPDAERTAGAAPWSVR